MPAKSFLREVAGAVSRVFGVQSSAGAANAGDIVALDERGRFDVSLMPRAGGAYCAYTDCMNTSSDLAPFLTQAISNGTLSSVAVRALSANRPGIVGINAGSNSNSGHRILSADMILEGGEQLDVLFMMPTNPTGGALYSSRIGWFTASNPTVNLSRGACIKLSGLSAVAECAVGGVRTEHGTGYTLSVDTWYQARISVANNGAAVNFQILVGGTPVWSVSITSNLPVAAATDAMQGGYMGSQSTGGAALCAYVDIMQLIIPVSSNRGDF